MKVDEHIEFKSLKELYSRVKPALYSKQKEIQRLGLKYVNEKDIWNYLVENVWTSKKDLELHELISDILHVDNYKINDYVMNKIAKLKENDTIIVDRDNLF